MKIIAYFCGFVLIASLCSCREEAKVCRTSIGGKKMEVSLEQYSDSSFALCLSLNGERHSEWELKYPVYQFDYGDITEDGIPEIAVGVIKTTRFDPRRDKRLFLFRITEAGYIRPLWLGSRVAQPLVDFKIVRENGKGKIRTIEKERSGNYLVAEYRWRGFGVEFQKYIGRELFLNKAKKLL